jgi:hypothetical protein
VCKKYDPDPAPDSKNAGNPREAELVHELAAGQR